MSTPIRIAQIMGYMNGGGVESVVMNYYRNINRDLVQFDFIVCQGSTQVPIDEITSLGGQVFFVSPYKHAVRFQNNLITLFHEQNWTVVHSHLNSLSTLSLRAAKRAGVPVRIAHSHSTAGKGEYAKNVLKVILKSQINRYPTHRLACSKHAGQWLFGSRYDFKVIYNAIDLAKFAPNLELRRKMRAKLGISTGRYVVGHVGRFMTQKNHAFLIRAFAELLRIRPDSLLVLIGEGELKDHICNVVHELGIDGHVMFLGQRANVNEYYQAFDAFVLPSLYEGLGMVGIEAQAAGVPCFFSNAVPREVDVLGMSAFLPIDDAALWANELSKVIVDVPRDSQIDKMSYYDIVHASTALARYYLDLSESVSHG